MMQAAESTVGGLSVSRETFQVLEDFAALVRKWNSAINLVGKGTLPDLWSRHVVDSAQLFRFLPPSAKVWLDLGSGGGFPGLVIAALARELAPDLRVELVESDLRKATFLRQAAQSLGLSVDVRSERIESLQPIQADVVSARALASLVDLLAYAHSHLRPGGIAVFPKGNRHAEELAEARRSWQFDVEAEPSLSDAGAAILVIRNIHRAQQD